MYQHLIDLYRICSKLGLMVKLSGLLVFSYRLTEGFFSQLYIQLDQLKSGERYMSFCGKDIPRKREKHESPEYCCMHFFSELSAEKFGDFIFKCQLTRLVNNAAYVQVFRYTNDKTVKDTLFYLSQPLSCYENIHPARQYFIVMLL